MASPLIRPSSASSATMALDPHRQSKFSLQLGDDLKPGPTSTTTHSSFSSVRFNHKPRLSTGSRKTKLRPQGEDSCAAKITDTDGDKTSKYTYSGPRRDSKGQYVLLVDQAKQTATLERLSSSYDLNLESTPQETSADRLKERYPHIPPFNEASEDVNGSFDDDEPDPTNPFDYRHFLKAVQQPNSNNVDRGISRSPSPLPQNTPKYQAVNNIQSPPGPSPAHPSALANGSPAPHRPVASRALQTSDILRPMNSKKRKIENTKAVPASSPLAITQTKDKPQDKRPAPSVRLERRASTRPNQPKPAPSKRAPLSSEFVHSSDDESSPSTPPTTSAAPKPSTTGAPSTGSALEFDLSASPPHTTQPLKNHHRKVLGAALGTPVSGPISLRSAANSPNSRVHSSPLGAAGRRAAPAEIDFGDALPREEDGEAEGDGDVVPMSLGSPAHGAVRKMGEIAAEGEEDVEGVDDFEAEMLQGFLDGDDGLGQGAAVEDEESDVSEAE